MRVPITNRSSVEGDERVEQNDADDHRDGDSDDRAGTNPDPLLVLRVEVPHEACGGLETRIVLLCHG